MGILRSLAAEVRVLTSGTYPEETLAVADFPVESDGILAGVSTRKRLRYRFSRRAPVLLPALSEQLAVAIELRWTIRRFACSRARTAASYAHEGPA